MRVLLTSETPLVLASGSPRRREILTLARVPHIVFSAPADENVIEGEQPDTYLSRVVRNKLEMALAHLPASLKASAPAILVADTSVIAFGEILGKPSAADNALAMIERLSGETHEVKTRFALALTGNSNDAVSAQVKSSHEQTVTTRVTFRKISNAEARAYVASGEGVDKAGGYAIQGYGSAFVERIEGSYSSVVGLPACEVVVALQALGWLACEAGE